MKQKEVNLIVDCSRQTFLFVQQLPQNPGWFMILAHLPLPADCMGN